MRNTVASTAWTGGKSWSDVVLWCRMSPDFSLFCCRTKLIKEESMIPPTDVFYIVRIC